MDKKAYLEDLLGRMGMVWPDGGPGARETRKTIRAALKEAKKLEDPDYLPVLQQLALERPGGDEASRSYRKAAYSTILAILWNRLDPDGDSFLARYMPGLFAANGRRRPDPQQPDLEALSFLISRLDAEPEREDQWLLINYLGAGDFGTNRLPIPEVLDLGPLLRLAKSEDTELRKDALRVLIRCPSAARLFSAAGWRRAARSVTPMSLRG